MSLTSKIVNESPAARRFRLLAPLVALLALMALMMAPGIIAEFRDGATSIGATTQGSTRLADGGEERGAVPEL
ncbi:MAG TPA: hypothetical protein VFY19_12135 [Geminicoccaceae bacterium]|nr:hypothetical protein [Geminicoccaceae bacterium]